MDKGLSIVEIERMLREGKAPDDIKEVDDLPDENAKANLERCLAKVERRKKPWEKEDKSKLNFME